MNHGCFGDENAPAEPDVQRRYGQNKPVAKDCDSCSNTVPGFEDRGRGLRGIFMVAVCATIFAVNLPSPTHAEEWPELQTFRNGDWSVSSSRDAAEAVTEQGVFKYVVWRSGQCGFQIKLKNGCPDGILNFAIMTRDAQASIVPTACFRTRFAHTIASWSAQEKCSTWNADAFANTEVIQFAFAREDGRFDIVDVPTKGLSETVKALHDLMRRIVRYEEKHHGQKNHGWR